MDGSIFLFFFFLQLFELLFAVVTFCLFQVDRQPVEMPAGKAVAEAPDPELPTFGILG